MIADPLTTTLAFVDNINAHNTRGVVNLLAPNHKLIDVNGDVENDNERIENGWRQYLENYPDYRIYIRRIFLENDHVYLIGHTTGSHLNLPDVEEFHAEGVIWVSQVKQGKISLWEIHNDTLAQYKRLKFVNFQEIFQPKLFAITIAKHLDLLPEDARTQDVRNVREYYSRLYRHAPPEVMLSIGEHLLFDQGYRFVPYELIYYHQGVIALLSPKKVIALGQGINSWSSTDIFAHYIAGPAWKQGVISDALIDQWIQDPSLWWRRAAVVSTIYLYGDVERMFKNAKKLIDDKEDLIVKAVSWVLREAIKYDSDAVRDFLCCHEDRLAARIKREVTNKLETGLKNPCKS